MRPVMPKKLVAPRSNIVILALSVALLAALAFIAVDKLKRPSMGKQPASARAMAFRQAATTLFATLPNADQTTKAAHRAMWDYLSSATEDQLPSYGELKQVVTSATVPHDYEYFFRDCLPRFSAKTLASSLSLKDPNIILSIPAGANARSRLFVNQDNASVGGLKRAIGFDKIGSRIAFAAAYSSPFNIPAGLAIMNGAVINPILQRFDGLVIMDSAGHLYITSVSKLQDGFRPLQVRERFSDYQQFVKRVSEYKMSVIQGTLLVDEGRNVLDERASQRALARRVIFTTEDGSIHIYDSLKRSQALSEVTNDLLEKYHAREAINLETGSNNFCLLKDKSTVTDYGQVLPGVVLSNVVVIEF